MDRPTSPSRRRTVLPRRRPLDPTAPARTRAAARTAAASGTRRALALAACLPVALLGASAGSVLTAAPAAAAYAYGSPAEQARVDIAVAFQGHDALAAITQSAYLTKGPKLGAAAERVLAASRQDLAKAVGGLSPASARLRDAVAASDRAKLQYAYGVDRYVGSPARAAAGQAAAKAAGERVVEALAPLVPSVPTAALTALVTAQDARDAAATRALGARSPSVYSLVQEAHLGTASLARAVAEGVDARASLAGSATSPAAEERVAFVALSAAHPVQVGLASDAGLTYGLRSPAYFGAKAALDRNTRDLTAAVGRLSTPATAAEFARQWNRHLADYVSYADGFIHPDVNQRVRAAIDLGAFDRDNAPQWVAASGIPTARVLPQLRIHTSGTITAIRLQAQRDPAQYAAAAMGTRHFAGYGDAVISNAQAARR